MSYKYFGRLVGKVATGTKSLTETTPADTTTPFDPQQPATKFMAYGEDATSLAFNRALSALSSNIDSLSSVLNSVTVKSGVISPYQNYAQTDTAHPNYAGELHWHKGSLSLSDASAGVGLDGELRSGATTISLAEPSDKVPANWVYIGLNEAELSRNVSFRRVEGQYGSSGSNRPDGHTDLLNITNPEDVDGLQTIYDTFHTVVPTHVFENASEGAGGYSYFNPKYKSQKQAYLTDNASTGIPLYVPPVKRIKTDLAPYNGSERYARISGWDSDGLYMKDYSADDLYLRPGCFVEIVGDGSEGAQAGNNGLFQVAAIVPADEAAPTASGSKLILTRGGFHKVTVRDYTQFMEGELVSWRTNPYHADSGDPTDPASSALNPSLRTNFAHVAFVIPRPDLNSDAKPDERPGDLYLRATPEASRFTTKDADGSPGGDWSRGVVAIGTGPTDLRYGGQRSYGSVGMPDKEEGATQNWNLLPGTFLFHGHAHFFPYDFGVGDWGMGGGAVAEVKFGSDILSSADGVHDSVVAAGEPVVFSLEPYPGIVYPCSPQGFALNPFFAFDEDNSFYSGGYQAHVKLLTTVREKLVSEVSPISVNEANGLDLGFDFADAQALKGWQYFLRSGDDPHKDRATGSDKDWGDLGGDAIRHVVSDGLNGPNAPTARILGNTLWELEVQTVTGNPPTNSLEQAFASNSWGANGPFVSFRHPESDLTYPGGLPRPERRYWGRIISATSYGDNTKGRIIVGGLYALPEDNHLSHDQLSALGSGGWPIQSATQSTYHNMTSGGSTFEDAHSGESWEVQKIIKAPSVSGTLDQEIGTLSKKQTIPFIPSHGLNAAYHNHFSSSAGLRGGIDGSTKANVFGGTGHIIHENPNRPFTLSLPNYDDFEQAIRIRSHATNVAVLRLDDSLHYLDNVHPGFSGNDLAKSIGQKLRIGWYEASTQLRAISTYFYTGVANYASNNGGAQSNKLIEAYWTGGGYETGTLLKDIGMNSGNSCLTFGSLLMSEIPGWFNIKGDGYQEFDPDALVLTEARSTVLTQFPMPNDSFRRDVVLESPLSTWAEDNFNQKPSFRSAVYNFRSTPSESQDRSILGALEATVLGNYNFDTINEATTILNSGDGIVELAAATMSTEHQFGVLSNGVIAGGYCWAHVNEEANERVPAHLLEMLTPSSASSFSAVPPQNGRDTSFLFADAYVLVGGTKWHVPAQFRTFQEFGYTGSDIESTEFLVFFDARARQLRCVAKPPTEPKPSALYSHVADQVNTESTVQGVVAEWEANEAWYYGLLEEAHIVPFAKLGTNSDGKIVTVANLRKPIARVDERTHILVGVCNHFEHLATRFPSGTFGQMKADAYQGAQMHFRNVGEALLYIGEMNKTRAFQGRQWTIEVVGTCYEEEVPSRGITFPLKFPVHGMRLIGHKGSSNSFMKNKATWIHNWSAGSGAIDYEWDRAWDSSKPVVHTEESNLIPFATAMGNQDQSSMILWEEPRPLFDLNSRQGVTVKDIHLEFRGSENPLSKMKGGYNDYGSYYDDAWLVENCLPHIAAFINGRSESDTSVPAIDADRSSFPYCGLYGIPNMSNAAFSGNYLFEGVTLHRGGILCDFYDPSSSLYEQNITALDNIVLRDCRAINVTHGLAAFGCSSNTNRQGYAGDWEDEKFVSFSAAESKGNYSDKKYIKGVLIENCEAVCVESEWTPNPRHKIFNDGPGLDPVLSSPAVSKRRAGVFATHTKELTIRDCSFQGSFAYGVYLGEDVTWYSRGWAEEPQHWTTGVVENCVITAPLVIGIYAASKHEHSDIKIKGNSIRECGWPYFVPTNTGFAGNKVDRIRAIRDPWAIFIDANGVDVVDNQIRSLVYSKENYGVAGASWGPNPIVGGDPIILIGQTHQPVGDDGQVVPFLDYSYEEMCGGIYLKRNLGAHLAQTPVSKVVGNNITMVGVALKGIVVADAEVIDAEDQGDYIQKYSSAQHSLLIADNTVNNSPTMIYQWMANQYDYRNFESDEYQDVWDAASADISSLGVDYPFSLYLGHNHTNVRVQNNSFCGPVVFSGGNDNSIFINNVVRDPMSVTQKDTGGTSFEHAWLPDAIEFFHESGFSGNASLLAIYDCRNLTVSENKLDKGHILADICYNLKVTDNNLFSPKGSTVEAFTNQPIGVFLKASCHESLISRNQLPGNGYIIVGGHDECHGVTISGNKLGLRADPKKAILLLGPGTGDQMTSEEWVNTQPDQQPYTGPYDKSGTETGDSYHNGGIYYWNGGGGLITGNTLLNNDIMVGNYLFVESGLWGGNMPLEAWIAHLNSQNNKRTGDGHTVSNNKLNGGSIHVYSEACQITGNDLCYYDHKNGRALVQGFWAALWSYHPNIEVNARNTIVQGNYVPGDIWLFHSHSSQVHNNKVGCDILVHNSDAISITNNYLSQTRPSQPSFASGTNPDFSSPKHGTGFGNIFINDSHRAVIKNNESVMGRESLVSRKNTKLLGVPTDPDMVLTYADFMSPFTSILAIDAYRDYMRYLTENVDEATGQVIDWLTFNGIDVNDPAYDQSNWTIYGITAVATGMASGGDAGILETYAELFGDEYTPLQVLTMTINNFTALLNARDRVGSKRIGGNPNPKYCLQPVPGNSEYLSGNATKYFWREGFGEGIQDDGYIGPFYPLNYQGDGFDHRVEYQLDEWARDFQEWGRRILATDCMSLTVDGNQMSHIELDDCRDSRITNNKLYWGTFNPGYVHGNNSILVSGDVGTIEVLDNRCGGSIWIRDNFNWGYPGDQGTSYTSGSTHVCATVSNNVVGHKRECTRHGTVYQPHHTSNTKLKGGVTPTVDEHGRVLKDNGSVAYNTYSSKYLYGGGGHIVIDNCTRLTAIGNDCESFMGPYPDRWFDQVQDGAEWGGIYVNRLGNPFTTPKNDEGKTNWHKQNYQTVITNNKASEVMGWVRQPPLYYFSNHLERIRKEMHPSDGEGSGFHIYAPHIIDVDVHNGESEEHDPAHLLDRVIPCIGASYGQWTGNRLTSQAWIYAAALSGEDVGSFTSAANSVLDQRWACTGSSLGKFDNEFNRWWGNMDSWTGPAQANGVMDGNAVPTCTGSRWFGNANYYISKNPLTKSGVPLNPDVMGFSGTYSTTSGALVTAPAVAGGQIGNLVFTAENSSQLLEDIDGDGIPNWQDTDIDGDGNPNITDPDADGDGIPNDSDLSPLDPGAS